MPQLITNEGMRGFSLVELSIVLVILGLLTGGILGGQALIRAAQLRAMPTEVGRYTTAAMTFRDKYFSMPGDMANATAFWGTATSCPGDFTTPATGPATCNGDGNGQINAWAETWRAWQHLANAGLIEGSYTGVQGTSTDTTYGIAGQNMPASKAGTNSGYAFVWVNSSNANSTSYFAGNYGNTLRWGAENGVDQGAVRLLPEEAWTVDMKMDDGKPGTGNVRTYLNSIRPQCSDSDIGASSAYQLTLKVRGCNLVFVTGL